MGTFVSITFIQVFLISQLILQGSSIPKQALDFDLLFKDELDGTLTSMSDESLGSESNEDVQREMNKYYKYLAKLDEKYYKKTFHENLNREEQNELKYFETMLKNVKELNSKSRRGGKGLILYL